MASALGIDLSDYQGYAIPAAIIIFIIWRQWRFKKVQNSMKELLANGALVIDVRSPEEFRQGANPQSVNIPLGEIDTRAGELDPNKTIVLCCASGGRSGMAAGILSAKGFKNVINAGPWTNTLG
jgi:phage shock protein E